MTGNPPGSKWRATPEKARGRKHINITLSDVAQRKLEALAKARGVSRSKVVEELITEAKR